MMHKFWVVTDPMMYQMQIRYVYEERFHAGRSTANLAIRLRTVESGRARQVIVVPARVFDFN